MPQRIRTIKPELSRHEVLFEAVVDTRLPLRFAFVMLLTCCDREGRFRWQPRVLKLDVLPYDDCDFECVLHALWRIGLIECYEHRAQLYGCIPTWHKHQRINQKEPASVLPPWTAEAAAAAQRRLLKKQFLGSDVEAMVDTTPVSEIAAPSEKDGSTCPIEQRECFSETEGLEVPSVEPVSLSDPTTHTFLNHFKPEQTEVLPALLKIDPSLRSELGSLNAAGFCREGASEPLGSTQAHAGTCQTQPDTCLGCTGKGREEELEQEGEMEMEREQEGKGTGEGGELLVARNVRPRSALEPVTEIFEYWKTVMQHPYAKLDSNRKKLICKALNLGYSLEALCEAIRGCSLTPHNQGHNDRGQRYDGLHIILRNSDQIDRFIHNAKNPPRIQTEATRRLQGNVACLEAWLDQKRKEAFHA